MASPNSTHRNRLTRPVGSVRIELGQKDSVFIHSYRDHIMFYDLAAPSASLGRVQLSLRFVALAAICASLASPVIAGPILPVYSRTFSDSVTGDNRFTSTGNQHWFINSGADRYANDVYERPTARTYEMLTIEAAASTDSELLSKVGTSIAATGVGNPVYFEYLDIVKGRFGFDNTFMYFQFELFGDDQLSSDGTATQGLGNLTSYRIRLGENLDGAGGLLLSADAGSDFQTAAFETFNPFKVNVYDDANLDVGGPGGISTVDEGTPSSNGYESKLISIGKTLVAGVPTVLYSRRLAGTSVIELAFDYETFNQTFSNAAMLPGNIQSVIFEANRGALSNANYLWNDTFSEIEAGSPYDASLDLQSIYEVDKLSGNLTIPPPQVVPEPSSMLMLGLGGILIAGAKARRKRSARRTL
jgi:PEP-CTERM motif